MGRPSKLDATVKKRFDGALRRGHPPKTAALYAGVSRATYYAWLERGEADRKAGKDTEYADFLDTIDRALALFYDKHLRRIDKASKSEVGAYEYRASLQILGRRAPEYFAERKGVELSNPEGRPLQVETKLIDVRNLPLDELERLARGEPSPGEGGA